MRPVRANIVIDRPVADVYEYLLDIASRPEFAPDLFLDFRLTRLESKGVGAGARFRLHPRRRERFAGITIVRADADADAIVVEEGSTGRSGRVPLVIEYLLKEGPGRTTRLRVGIETAPLWPSDRIREIGLHRHVRRRLPRALRRLRDILEGAPGTGRGDRPTVAGLDPHWVPNP